MEKIFKIESPNHKMRQCLFWYDAPLLYTAECDGNYFIASKVDEDGSIEDGWKTTYLYTPLPKEFCEMVEVCYRHNNYIANWVQLSLAKTSGKFFFTEEYYKKDAEHSSREWWEPYSEELDREYIGDVYEDDPRFEKKKGLVNWFKSLLS